jgi:hypothetical protein
MGKKLLRLKELEDCVSEFIAPFGLKAKADTDFAYYYKPEIVTFSIFEITALDDFMLDAESRFPNVHGIPTFIWSLMHEVGHHETWDDLTDEELELSKDIKDKIDESHESRLTYYTSPDEYAATDWAGHYIEKNQDKILDFWDKFLVVLKDFYVVNNIEYA